MNESFIDSGGQLFCQACREEQSTKKSVTNSRYQVREACYSGKIRLEKKGASETRLADAWRKYSEEIRPV